MPLITPTEYSGRAQNGLELPLWQSLEWRRYQEALGRQTRLYGLKKGLNGGGCMALVVIDRTVFGFSVWDIPRGPVGTDSEAVAELLDEIVKDARKAGALSMYFSPVHPPRSIPHTSSPRKEQPEATIVLDLTRSDDELMAQMKPKGRYNIRLAKKHGVTVAESHDVDAFYALLQRTAARDGFAIQPKEHYAKFLRVVPGSFLLLAFRKQPTASGRPEQPIAGLLGVSHGKTGIYYYGASAYECRSLMAPYLLQWEALRHCKAAGCTEYDLLGIAREAADGHPWAGATRFKLQFGGTARTYPPEREIVLRPVLKTLLDWKRKMFA